MNTSILVPLDGSAFAERALPYAGALAQTTGQRVCLVGVLPEKAPSRRSSAGEEADNRTELQSILTGMTKRLRASGLRVTSHLRQGEIAPSILDAAREFEASHIVMGTHGRSGIRRWIFGSVADAVVRHASTPVVLIPPDCAREWPGDRVERILVPLDGSLVGEAALEPACDLALKFPAEVILLRVVEAPGGTAETAAIAYLEETLEGVRERGVTTDVAVGFRSVEGAIADTARERNVDLIVMATHGLGGAARLVVGSVATELIQRATLPIMVVRPAALLDPAPAADAAPTGA
ncbi:MAG: universal stress protein [Chloroflexi bacterium]|nr:universal stress protein [Chloroflexota bacterium]